MKKVQTSGVRVLAVSGGVDSVVLLHMMAGGIKHEPYQFLNAEPTQLSELRSSSQLLTRAEIVIAHFDHGIREDSADDARFVAGLSGVYGLRFETVRAELGKGASEAIARKARYDFLRRVQTKYNAQAIVTAHHQDDLLETIIINWHRGTRSRGLSSLRSRPDMERPLLCWSKQRIREYAIEHKLEWCEDYTNADESYLRNVIRRRVVPRLTYPERKKLLSCSRRAAILNDEIDVMIAQLLAIFTSAKSLDRDVLRSLPSEVAAEVMAAWLRRYTPAVVTTKLLARLIGATQIGRNNSQVDIDQGYSFRVERHSLILTRAP